MNLYSLLAQIPLTLPADSIPAPAQDLKALKSLSFDELINRMVSGLVEFAIHLAIAILVFYVGKFIIRRLFTITATILHRRNVEQSLTTFVLSLIKILLYFILIITVIGILGINTSSFLAVFASVGVAIGMALSGTLQNFAGGVPILLLKPYKIGDYIEAQGFAGTVTEIQIFHTIINTYDNKSLIIPNGGLSTGSISNWSREDYRRVDWSVSISYGDDVDKAREALVDIMLSDKRVVEKYVEDARKLRQEKAAAAAIEAGDVPEVEKPRGFFGRLFHKKIKKAPVWDDIPINANILQHIEKVDRSPSVVVDVLADSSVNLKARAWVHRDDYWGVYYGINERIYKELPAAGISFPFPQMDVHMKKEA